VKLSGSHEEIAFQRYLSKGPLAMLPLKGGNMASLVWSTTPEHAESLKVSFAETSRTRLRALRA
ncbi:unnamed protein product, partial [Hapterophycus canaliculatus]